MTLIEHQKNIISKELERLSAKTSQNRVAYNAGVSNATINKMIRGKWDEISSEMWRRVQTNLRIEFDWNHAETTNFKILQGLCKTAQDNSLSIAISEDAGKGKSQSYTIYERHHKNVVYIECKNYWSKKQYIETLLAAVGLSTVGTTNVLIDRFIKYMKGQHRPLIIIDQFDKLKDSQTDLFMDFYNDLSHNCGFVISGVKALEKRILNGVNKQKIGYSEIYSRIGRKFITLEPITHADVKLICNANGVNDEEAIWYIFNNCEQDLRRVRRDVEKFHLQAIKNNDVVFEELSPSKPKKPKEIPLRVIEDAAEVIEATQDPKRAVAYVRRNFKNCPQTDAEILSKIDKYRTVTA